MTTRYKINRFLDRFKLRKSDNDGIDRSAFDDEEDEGVGGDETYKFSIPESCIFHATWFGSIESRSAWLAYDVDDVNLLDGPDEEPFGSVSYELAYGDCMSDVVQDLVLPDELGGWFVLEGLTSHWHEYTSMESMYPEVDHTWDEPTRYRRATWEEIRNHSSFGIWTDTADWLRGLVSGVPGADPSRFVCWMATARLKWHQTLGWFERRIPALERNRA